MTEQWQELKETIIELRDNGGTGTQQDVCKFLANYMETLEKQMQESRWIPVGERLPEFTADYKVTVGINYDGGGMFPEVRIALYNKVYKCWVVYESDRAIVGDVVAWMPISEPYKEDAE